MPLPGLRHWRLQRGLSQAQLAKRADLTADYLFKVESGRRGCNPETAQLLADLLEADLRDLRTNHDAPEAGVPPKGVPPKGVPPKPAPENRLPARATGLPEDHP